MGSGGVWRGRKFRPGQQPSQGWCPSPPGDTVEQMCDPTQALEVFQTHVYKSGDFTYNILVSGFFGKIRLASPGLHVGNHTAASLEPLPHRSPPASPHGSPPPPPKPQSQPASSYAVHTVEQHVFVAMSLSEEANQRNRKKEKRGSIWN